MLKDIWRAGALVRILDMPWLGYSAPIGCFIAQTYAALADLEGEQTRERQGGDIDAAKRAGRPAASLRQDLHTAGQDQRLGLTRANTPHRFLLRLFGVRSGADLVSVASKKRRLAGTAHAPPNSEAEDQPLSADKIAPPGPSWIRAADLRLGSLEDLMAKLAAGPD